MKRDRIYKVLDRYRITKGKKFRLKDVDPKDTYGLKSELKSEAKTLLQEYLQGRRLPLPHYSVVATRGDAHEQIFEVSCEIAPLAIHARGEGPSRRSAEQEAARAAYEQATRV